MAVALVGYSGKCVSNSATASSRRVLLGKDHVNMDLSDREQTEAPLASSAVTSSPYGALHGRISRIVQAHSGHQIEESLQHLLPEGTSKNSIFARNLRWPWDEAHEKLKTFDSDLTPISIGSALPGAPAADMTLNQSSVSSMPSRWFQNLPEVTRRNSVAVAGSLGTLTDFG